MFNVFWNLLRESLQTLYFVNNSEHEIRRQSYYKIVKGTSTLKQIRMSVYGVKLFESILPIILSPK